MKKLTILVVFSVILSGCNIAEITKRLGLYENEYVISEDYSYVTEIEGYQHIEVPIENDSSFELGDDYLDVFYTDSKYVPFLELENYVNLLGEVIDEDLIVTYDVENDTWRMLYDIMSYYEYVEFDFKQNTVSISSINMIDNGFQSGDSASQLGETMDKYYSNSGRRVVKEKSSMTIELSDYDIELVNVNGNHLVPMHLLFFFFSAYDNDFYYTGDTAYYLDIFASDLSQEILYGSKDIVYSDAVIKNSNSFTQLIFENFYGLKDIRENEIDNIKHITRAFDYMKSFNNFIYDLDDRHTSVYLYTYGVNGRNIDKYDQEDPVDNRTRIGCDTVTDEIKVVELDPSSVRVEVNSLSSPDFADEYFETLNTVRDKENIVIDIRCNGGGYVANAPVLIYPFVEEDVDVNSMTIDGGQHTSTFVKSSSVDFEVINDANVYLLTSDFTFSAANLATSLFEEYEVGQVIGEQSGGGTAAIALVSHPNGAIISMSFGSMILTDSDFEIIEDGIEPDIPFTIDGTILDQTVLEVINNKEE